MAYATRAREDIAGCVPQFFSKKYPLQTESMIDSLCELFALRETRKATRAKNRAKQEQAKRVEKQDDLNNPW